MDHRSHRMFALILCGATNIIHGAMSSYTIQYNTIHLLPPHSYNNRAHQSSLVCPFFFDNNKNRSFKDNTENLIRCYTEPLNAALYCMSIVKPHMLM